MKRRAAAGASPSRVNAIRALLRAALNVAIEREYVYRNAAKLARPFQVVRLGAYWNRVEPRPGAQLDPSRCLVVLRRQLESQGLGDAVEVEVEVVPRLEVDPAAGKLRRIISHVGPPADLEPVVSGATITG